MILRVAVTDDQHQPVAYLHIRRYYPPGEPAPGEICLYSWQIHEPGADQPVQGDGVPHPYNGQDPPWALIDVILADAGYHPDNW